jgi:hypothetical protein
MSYLGGYVKVLKITDGYKTPYTGVTGESERIRLKKTKYRRGYYRMEGVKGYELFYVREPIEVTELQVKDRSGTWRTIMVDDPLHWHGMQELAELCTPGSVLTTGLGMGLILHHLVKRRDISRIKVIEIDPDLVEFIKPYIPNDPRIEIEIDDYFHYIVKVDEKFNSIVIDLWTVGEDDTREYRRRVLLSMLSAYVITKHRMPSARVLVWGIRGYTFEEGDAL